MAGKTSLKTWIATALDDRQCLDCHAKIEGFDGTLEFRGIPLHVECIGSLCPRCAARREETHRLTTPQL
jgi:hypothetical protein